jgi:hypothetical protein
MPARGTATNESFQDCRGACPGQRCPPPREEMPATPPGIVKPGLVRFTAISTRLPGGVIR